MAKELLDVLRKQFGKNSVIDLMDESLDMSKRIPTGLPSIDGILGGGIYAGSLVELYGRESTGKSTLALMLAATTQKNNDAVLWLDYEHSFDPVYAKSLELDLSGDKIVLVQPATAETGLEMIDTVLTTNTAKLIVIDSLAAMQPKRFLDDGPSGETYPLLPKMLSNALRGWLGKLDSTNTTLLLINHLKDKIGAHSFFPQTYTPGGTAPKFYANIRIEMGLRKRLKKVVKGEENVYGVQVQMETKKNRHFPPYKKVMLDLIFGKGFEDSITPAEQDSELEESVDSKADDTAKKTRNRGEKNQTFSDSVPL